MKNKFSKKIIIIILGILVIIAGCVIFVVCRLNNDGMNNKDIYNIKYRVYQNGKWSKYSKNGVTIGDMENPIQNIEFKYNDKKGSIHFHAYINDWTEQIYKPLKNSVDNIYGIKIGDSDTLYRKYDICYRTYNKKDKWLNWICNDMISGNIEEPITAIEIKLILKNSDKKEYLKDYDDEIETSKGFLQGE